MIIESLPLHLRCTCGHHLLGGTISLRIEGSIRGHELVIGWIDLMCPKCRHRHVSAEDDFSRAVNALEKNLNGLT